VKVRPYNSPILRVLEFKIDTGADFSTISKETLYALGYSEDWINTNIDRENNCIYMDRLSNLDERNAKYPDRQLNFIES